MVSENMAIIRFYFYFYNVLAQSLGDQELKLAHTQSQSLSHTWICAQPLQTSSFGGLLVAIVAGTM